MISALRLRQPLSLFPSDALSLFGGLSPRSSAFSESQATRWTESAAGGVLEVDLPGHARDGFDISLQDRTLAIRGEIRARPSPAGQDGEAALKTSRLYSIPFDVDSQKVSASYVDGVLSITLPKSEKSQAWKIVIS